MLPRHLLFVVFHFVFVVCHNAASPNVDDLVDPTASPPKLSPTPLVIWPGMGDSCHNDFSIGYVTRLFRQLVSPKMHVHCVDFNATWLTTTTMTFMSNVDELIEKACRGIRADVNLKGGYNAIGFSQGSQFLRGIAQRCPDPPMRSLISVGGQHQGVYGLPVCAKLTVVSDFLYLFCDWARSMTSWLVKIPLIRSYVVQAQYWHDPTDHDAYKGLNNFLADLNQENTYNSSYKTNLLRLKHLVLVKFTDDGMVVPNESQWFGFYKRGSTVEIESLQESSLYLEDKLGLRQMEIEGRLHFLEVPGDHLQLRPEDFDTFAENFLK